MTFLPFLLVTFSYYSGIDTPHHRRQSSHSYLCLSLPPEIHFLSTLSAKCHYSHTFHAHPVSIIHITPNPTTHLSPTTTLRQGTGLRPSLFPNPTTIPSCLSTRYSTAQCVSSVWTFTYTSILSDFPFSFTLFHFCIKVHVS